jgi:hypothetical protein
MVYVTLPTVTRTIYGPTTGCFECDLQGRKKERKEGRKGERKTECDKRHVRTVYVEGVFKVTLTGAGVCDVFRVQAAIKTLSRLTSGYLWALNT